MDRDLQAAAWDAFLVTLLHLLASRAIAVASGSTSPLDYGNVAAFCSIVAFVNYVLRRTNRPMKNLFSNAVYLNIGMTMSKSFL